MIDGVSDAGEKLVMINAVPAVRWLYGYGIALLSNRVGVRFPIMVAAC